MPRSNPVRWIVVYEGIVICQDLNYSYLVKNNKFHIPQDLRTCIQQQSTNHNNGDQGSSWCGPWLLLGLKRNHEEPFMRRYPSWTNLLTSWFFFTLFLRMEREFSIENWDCEMSRLYREVESILTNVRLIVRPSTVWSFLLNETRFIKDWQPINDHSAERWELWMINLMSTNDWVQSKWNETNQFTSREAVTRESTRLPCATLAVAL